MNKKFNFTLKQKIGNYIGLKIFKWLSPFHYNIYSNGLRPAIDFMKKYFNGKKIIGCEIGSYECDNALRLLRNLNLEKLYLIDILNIQKHINKKLRDYEDKIVFIHLDSDKAKNYIREYLDFVYVDGNHEFKQVYKDLENYGYLVKSNGVISGHDFFGSHIGVIKAVFKYVKKHNYKLYTGHWDYWIVKTPYFLS